MTIEEYLTNVTKIYYQVSAIVEGKQLLVDGTINRRADLLDASGKLGRVRFSNLSLPADTKIDSTGTDHCIINFGDTKLVIWPTIRRLVPKSEFQLNVDGTVNCQWCGEVTQPTAEDNVIHWYCKNCGNESIPTRR